MFQFVLEKDIWGYKMIIKTYSPKTLKEKETITQITSLIWNSRFYKNGSFELSTPTDKFSLNDIIAYSYNGEIRSGIVLKITESLTEYIVSGYDLKGILNFRYITAPTEYSGTPEKILKTIAEEFLMTEDRTIFGLEISKDSGNGEKTTFIPKTGFLENELQSFCLSNEIGISIKFDLNKIIFQTHIGTDRSDKIVFGRKFHNIDDIQYVKDLFNTYNVGYSVDGAGNEFVLGNEKGIFRRECYQKENIDDYLKEKSEIETLRGTTTEFYKYGVDYFLGDYVTVVHKKLKSKKQITEIKEVYERSKFSIIPIFGTEKENPLQRIMKGV